MVWVQTGALVVCPKRPCKPLAAQLCHAFLMQRLLTLCLHLSGVCCCLRIILVEQGVQLIKTALAVPLTWLSCRPW